ncbi:MAG: hypothetical protein Metus_0472 [Candidatus Methanosuratincola subterraneus]|uniref:Uncharacterized protein n=1 Tax=Methanosuratincola subterraneus TaxID=2593994 RepID=A0A444L7Z7_METS7|nr:MAG: hypothetical protein Metus_0472 [Candidatus Methanosuratincola subterraneus]
MVVNSDQAWQGDIAILPDSDLLVEGCTITISGGNLTVYGNVTIQDASIVTSEEAVACISVAGDGYIKMNNSKIAPEITLVLKDSAKAEIYDSNVFSVEGRNSSKVKIIRSQISQIRVFDDSVQYLEGLFGMMTDVDKYSSSGSPCPRMEIYNCSLRSVRIWEDGYSILSVAHSKIGFLQTRGQTRITFENMSVVSNWTHNGSVVWNRRQFDHIGNFQIEWGESYAGGEINSSGAEVVIRQLEVVDDPPAPLPPGLLGAGKFINMTIYGPKWAKKETMCFINFTGNQVASMDPATLKIYRYTPGLGWQQLQTTGVDLSGQYAWCNITSEEEVFMAFLAALGKGSGGGALPELASQYFDVTLVFGLAIIVAALVIAAAYIKYTRRGR